MKYDLRLTSLLAKQNCGTDFNFIDELISKPEIGSQLREPEAGVVIKKKLKKNLAFILEKLGPYLYKL